MSEGPSVISALRAVMEDVQAIGKTDHNDQQNFNFRGVDAVINAVGPALRKHGVIVVPVSAEYDEQRYQTSRGTQMRGVTASIGYRFYGPRGDSIDAHVLGEASDSGDKAIPKAFSVAYRTLLLQALCVPTDEVDPDAQSHDRAGDPHGLKSARADAEPVASRKAPTNGAPVDNPADVVLHFSKNEGKRLGDLTKNQLRWYAEDWELRDNSTVEDELVKAAAVELHTGKKPEPVVAGASELDDIPFAPSWI